MTDNPKQSLPDIDNLIDMFQRVTEPKIYWWSTNISEDITDSGDVSLYRWGELLQTDYKAELCNLGGICNKDRSQWILYAVAGKGVTLEFYKKVADVCASVVKALEINLIPKFRVTLYERLEFSGGKCFTSFTPARYNKFTDWRESVFKLLWVTEQPRPRLSVSEYLDALAENGNKLLPASGGATVESYWITSWFEFIFNTAQESGCSIQTHSASQFTGMEKAEIPFRRIDHDICEASIQALKFLRMKAKQRTKSQEKEGQDYTEQSPMPQLTKVSDQKRVRQVNRQLNEMKDFLEELPAKKIRLFDTEAKKKRWKEIQAENQKGGEKRERDKQNADEYYNIEPLNQLHLCDNGGLYGAYYIIDKYTDLIKDKKWNEFAEGHLQYEDEDHLILEWIEAGYPSGCIARLNEALELIRLDLEQTERVAPESKKIKEPSKEAIQAYWLYISTGWSQSEIAKIMTKQSKNGKKYRQDSISRLKDKAKDWLEKMGFDSFPEHMTTNILTMEPNKLEMGVRQDGKITGDPHHMKKKIEDHDSGFDD